MNSSKKQNKRTVQFLFGLWRIAPIGTWGMVTSQVLGTALDTAIAPLFLAQLMTQIASGTASTHRSLGLLLGYMLCFSAGQIVGTRITIALAYMSEGRMQMEVGERMLKNQIDKSMTFHANHMSGSIISDANKLNGAIERFWDMLVFTATPIVTAVLSVCIVLAFLVWQYALVLFVLTIAIGSFIARGQNRIAPKSRQQSEKSTALTAHFSDVIANIGTVKSFAGGAREQAERGRLAGAWRKANLEEMKVVLLMTGSYSVLLTTLNVVAFVAAILVTQHHVAHIGSTFLMLSYTLNISAQLWQINGFTRTYVRIMGDAAPMIGMLDEPIELNDPAHPEPVHITHGLVNFQDVVFAHDDADTPIFNNLNLRIKPGEKVGLVGHSGSGKTTLTRLLLRFSDIQSGTIQIDGQNIAAITQDDLRQHIAYVPQEPMLFHRSVRENIAYGNSEADSALIEGVARMASAHEFITQLPKGYETLVGERGVKLSGGQRQRIAIARALLKNAPILVLDEATSALDSESEVLIQQALWKLMEGRTAIVIAHRLSTIQKMDRIIVLDNGRIVEEGSHKELVGKKDGTYAKLWAHQSGGFIEE